MQLTIKFNLKIKWGKINKFCKIAKSVNLQKRENWKMKIKM